MEWETVTSKLVIDSKHFRVRRDEVRLPSGGVLDDYWVWESPDIVTVVPRTIDGDFVLVRQWRHAVARMLLQFPAGAVDARDEDEIAAAARELREETGYTAPTWSHLGDTVAVPTKATGWHRLYLADGAEKTCEPAIDPTEETEVVLVDSPTLVKLLTSGEIAVGDSVSAGLLTLRHLGI